MKKLAVLLALTTSLVACSKKDDGGGGGGGNVAGGGGDCVAAVDKALTAMTQGQSMQGIEAVKGQLKTVYVSHCEKNTWPAEVISCFAASSGMTGIKACREKLPADQAQAIAGEIRQIMMGSMQGGGGSPMHGGGGAPPMGGTEGPPKTN